MALAWNKHGVSCYCGHVLDVLPTLPERSVQCCVTSPPYWGLRDYGVDGQLGLERTPDEFIANMVDVFRGVRRVLRDDGVCWVNIGDSYASSGRSDRKESPGVGAKQEMRKPGRSLKWKSGGGSDFSWSIPTAYGDVKPKDLVGIPWRLAFALQSDGWYLRSEIIWHKPNPMPESVTDRPTKAHEQIFLLTKNAKYFYDNIGSAEPLDRPNEASRQTPARFGGANKFVEAQKQSRLHSGNEYRGTATGTRNMRSVWSISPQNYRGAHFATFPEELARRCILAGTKAGDTVLDPFFGSGTVGRVSRWHERQCVGIELNKEYAEQARERVCAPLVNDAPKQVESLVGQKAMF